jgi:hypothetical protein
MEEFGIVLAKTTQAKRESLLPIWSLESEESFRMLNVAKKKSISQLQPISS